MAAIKLSQVSKSYKGVYALDKITLSVPVGKVYGLLGKNGAGKTTTLRIVTGLIHADDGDIEVMGRKVNCKRPNEGGHIGAIIEAPGLYGNLSAIDNVRLASHMGGTRDADCEGMLSEVGLLGTGRKKVKQFSSGMKQRLGIACALINLPQILILDEPTVGLDPEGVSDLRKLIRRLADEKNMTVVLSSHILAEVEQIADMVGIIHEGRLVDEFDLKELKEMEGVKSETGNLEQRFFEVINNGTKKESES